MALPPMEEIWRVHKRFIVAVGAGTAIFFGGLSYAWTADAEARAFARQAREAEADIRALSDAIAGREGFEAGVAQALELTVKPETREAVEFRPRPAFAVKEDDSKFIVYRQAIEAVESTRAEARKKNISCPEDMGFVKDPPEDRVRIHVAGADALERVLAALVSAGVRSIESLKVGDAEYVKTVEESAEARPEGEGAEPAQPQVAPPAEPPVLRRIPVRVSAVATLGVVELFLSAFQRPASTLEVAQLRITKQADGLVKLECELCALTLVPAAEAKAAKGGPAAGGRRPPIRQGGRVR